MSSGVIQALTFIIGTIARLYIMVLLVRLLLPWFQVNYRNPLTQALLSLTSPLVVPLRRIMPPIGKLDTATLLVSFAVHYLALWVIVALHGMNASIAVIALSSVLGLVSQAIMLFVFAILIRIILSWFAGGAYNPAIAILDALTEPVLRPFRRLIPPIGGFDISPIFPIILLSALNIIVRDYAAIVL